MAANSHISELSSPSTAKASYIPTLPLHRSLTITILHLSLYLAPDYLQRHT